MMRTAQNLDIAVVVSGDGDFAPAIRAVQQMGVRVEVISFRGNTSSDLIEVADTFIDITQIAKVEKGSSRSGRRVAAEDDLSMTEVPDKESEGNRRAARPRRGRGRPAERDEAPQRPIARPRGAHGGRRRSPMAAPRASSRCRARSCRAPGRVRSTDSRSRRSSMRSVEVVEGEAPSRAETGEGDGAAAAPPGRSRSGPSGGEPPTRRRRCAVEAAGEVAVAARRGRSRSSRRVEAPRGRGDDHAAALPARIGRLPTPFDDLEARPAGPRARRRSGPSGTSSSAAGPPRGAASRRCPMTRRTSTSRRSRSTCSPSAASQRQPRRRQSRWRRPWRPQRGLRGRHRP